MTRAVAALCPPRSEPERRCNRVSGKPLPKKPEKAAFPKDFRMLCDMSGNLMILAHSASMDRWIRDQRSVSRQVSVTSSGRMCLYLLFRHTSQTPELIWPEDG